MKVFLTGASGVVGRSAMSALVEAGHDVVGLARSETAADTVRSFGARPHLGSIFETESLVAGMQDAEVVLNLVGNVPSGAARFRPGAWRVHDRLRSHGADVVVRAAAETGVRRVVQQSLSAVYADGGDDWIDEHDLVDVTAAAEPLVMAETFAASHAATGGDSVVLRLGLLLGPEPMTRWWIRRARAGHPTGLGSPDGWTHVVHPDDIGTAAVHALTAPAGVYNVGAEPLRREELAEAFAIAGGRRGARFHAPATQRLLGHRLELYTRSQRVSSQRFSDRTGWYPNHPKFTLDWFSHAV
ncbi:NAD-dependent epimerase/dehydratase family protein [Aeromicrobium sp. Root495]|uniref:NAD-dependent epimerase/dehydratase family protein n=1 Tax=Aeromicrobium sp. Root495 TaxID=1736550 RepID=UPI00138F9225|nr:NAD-dependent epimerase/dehydratase family protein [Aeromicrobium sp. Root495]